MSQTYHASHHKPGCPVSITFHTVEAEEAAKAEAAALGLTMQEFVDRLLHREISP